MATRIDPPKVATYESSKCDIDKSAYFGGESPRDFIKTPGSKTKRDRPINLDCFQFPEQVGAAASVVVGPAATAKPVAGANDTPATPTRAYTAYRAAVDNKANRDRLISVLIKHADDQCVRTSGQVMGNQTAVNLILDMLTTGLTSAATVVTGRQADSILTGLGALTSGTRSHVNADIYRGQFVEAITTVITGEQHRLLETINVKRKQPTAEYNVDDAVRDVNEYYQTCSFYKGLELLLKYAKDYPKLAQDQARELAKADVRRLDETIAIQSSAYERLAARSPESPLLADLKARIDETSAARSAQWAVAYPDAASAKGAAPTPEKEEPSPSPKPEQPGAPGDAPDGP